ncbi:MAG: hypothetical protein KBS55_01025 [Bacteroidales bacterium]|nr:hypothetical protein [Candidatus Cryptobacteroides aphodequi]
MKKVIVFIFAILMSVYAMYAQTTKDIIKERKQIANLSQSELNARASKVAHKEAKKLTKEGWIVAPGQLPLEKQLDKSYNMNYEYEESGLPKYIFGAAMSVGGVYDAAKMQAIELAKSDLASMIQTEVTSLIESTIGNEQISQEDGASLVSTVKASKDLIVKKLGRTFTVIECYKNLPNKAVQVRVVLAYNAKMAIDDAKAVIEKELELQGQDLHEQLDAIWEQNK